MKQVQSTNCFAKQSLGHMKELIAKELRKQIKVNAWTQQVASEILGVSTNIVGFINRGEEWRVSFDTMYVAAIYAGITVNISLDVPK